VAEEQAHNTSGEAIPLPGEQEPPVAEKPVATRRKISQYVVSVDDATGFTVKVEKLDEATGQRKELTQEEYAAAYALVSYAMPYYAAYTAPLYDPMQAYRSYLKALADYWKAFADGLGGYTDAYGGYSAPAGGYSAPTGQDYDPTTAAAYAQGAADLAAALSMLPY
jgi:hypothetical protein